MLVGQLYEFACTLTQCMLDAGPTSPALAQLHAYMNKSKTLYFRKLEKLTVSPVNIGCTSPVYLQMNQVEACICNIVIATKYVQCSNSVPD